MGTLVDETDSLCSNDYNALGLKNLRTDNLGKPRVLSLLSTLLEKTVEKNERAKIEDVITVFHGLRAPCLSIQQYIDRIFKYACCSPSCFVIAYIYMDRYIQRSYLILTSLNIHRLLITSVMVAAKFMDDGFFNNAYYARVGGISTAELNKLELKFLFCLDFQLHVSVHIFGKYCDVFKTEGKGGLIERSIHACGAEESKDDSACVQSINALTLSQCRRIP